MSQAAINRASRQATRARSFGPDPRCARCGWNDVEALCRIGDEILCYECVQSEHGCSPAEAHHHFRRKTDPSTVTVPGNAHRPLSDAQYDRPEALRLGGPRDPLLWIAEGILGLRDHLAFWVARIGAVADFLIQLSGDLRERLSPGERAELPRLFGMGFA
jgi:hypothetical protein